MTTQNNQRRTQGNGAAKTETAKIKTARLKRPSKAQELTLRAWKKTYESRGKANKAA